MGISTIIVAIFSCLICAGILSRLALIILSRRLKKKFGIEFGIGSFGFFVLKDVWIKRKEQAIFKIKSISLASRLLHREYLKPLNIIISNPDVCISETQDYLRDGTKAKHDTEPTGKSSKQIGMFLHSLLYLSQYIGVIFPDFNLTIIKKDIKVTFRSRIAFKVEAKRVQENERTYEWSASVDEATIKLFEASKPLMECSLRLFVCATSKPTSLTSPMDTRVKLSRLTFTFKEGLVKQILQQRNVKQSEPDISKESIQDTDNRSLQKKLPKNAVLSMEDCKIVYVSARGRELYLSWHCEVLWKSSFEDASGDVQQLTYELSLDLTGLVFNSSCNKLLLNKQVECSIKKTSVVDNGGCSVALNLDTFHSSIIQDELEFWIEEARNCFPIENLSTKVPASSKSASKGSSVADILLPRWSIKVMMQNCSCDIMGTCATTGQYYPILNTYLGQLEINVSGFPQETTEFSSIRASFVMNDLYTYMNEIQFKVTEKSSDSGMDKPAVLPTTESHIWGRIFELGKITVEVSSDSVLFDASKPLILTSSAQVTYLACETSTAVAVAIKDLYNIVNKLGLLGRKNLSTLQQDNQIVGNKGSFRVHLDVEMSVSNVNFFLLGERAHGLNSLHTRLDHVDISTGSKDEPMLWEINELRLCRIYDMNKDRSYNCFDQDLLKPCLLYVPSVSTCFFRKKQPKSLTVSIQDCFLDWDTTKHMIIYEQLNYFTEAKHVLSSLLEKESSSELKEKPNALKMDVKLDIINARMNMATSKENSFGIEMNNFSLGLSQDETFVKASEVDVLFDKNAIFKLLEAEVRRVSGERFKCNREKYDNISPQNDNALYIEMEKFQSIFPHQFDFASSLECLLNIFKMLKKLHIKAKPTNYKEPLPPDLHIVCSVLTFELEDDPFEVKIEQNYLLQLDEMDECAEREMKLKERLKDIQGAFVSSKKMEEIMRNLAAKNAQIYIKRSMAIHQDNGKRSVLFKCAVRDLDLMVLADNSFHGRDKVLEQLKAIDSASPFPEEIEFSTLWCRIVDGRSKYLTMSIREYQQPLLFIDCFNVNGTLIGAEQTGEEKSRREAVVEIDGPWGDMVVSKNMPPLKFYHDMNWAMDVLEIGWGINFEPAWATVALGFDLLSKASVDASEPLPFWDKMRLLFHGRLKMSVKELDIVLSASRDPNNTTEKMDIVWEDFFFDWTNACIVIKGNFDLHIRTASKYDDSRVLHFPGFEVRFDLEWLCLGNPNDHHRALPCNPEKIAATKTHDSYRNFRSQNVNLSIHFETGKDFGKEELKVNPPTLFLYASTLRWFQKYQAVVLNNVSRPIRRGPYFGNVKPRKPTLGRHYKFLDINFVFNRLHVNYFGSFTKDAGFEMVVSSGSFGANYEVDVQTVHDDLQLTRRPVSKWILCGLQSELDKVSTDLFSNLPETDELIQKEIDDEIIDIERQTKSCFLFSVKRVNYRRKLPGSDASSYIHKVELNDFRGAWTAFNRKITVELFEAYENMQMLKRVLSSEALKPAKDATSQDFRRQHKDSVLDSATSNSKANPGHDDRLLQQLVSEQGSKFLAQVEQGDTESEGQQKHADVDDVIQLNWHIELVNSQVILIGRESKGALLITAANADIMKRLHRPVDTNNDVMMKLNKVTWNGKLKNLQCFATSMSMNDLSSTSIPWMNSSTISGMSNSTDSDGQSNVASFMKSSYCVGSIVNVSFGGSTVELQRVASPSQCEFNYVSLDPELDPFAEEFEATQDTSPLLGASFAPQANLANTLFITNPTLEISTSPDQYAMIMEICQTLLLYTEPKKREKEDRFEKMKFRMQLSAGEDTKGDIQELQNCVRDSLSYLRRCERQLFEYRRNADSTLCDENDCSQSIAMELKEAILDLQDQVNVTKEQINVDSEELKMMIRIYKDFSLTSASPSPTKGRSKNYIVKQSDIIFDDMRWRLTQQDGQLGIADVQFKKFHYNKLTFNDNGVEHRLELGGFAVHNLIPNEPYRELLVPHEINVRRHVDKSVFVRVYCRVQSPVAGISVREHFEVNVCPIAVRLTHRFYHYMASFFFSRKVEKVDQSDGPEVDSGNKGKDDIEESQGDQAQTTHSFKKPAPPRPPPPKLVQPPKQQLPSASPVKQPHMLQPTYLDLQAEERLKKKPNLSLSLQSPKESVGAPAPSPVSSAVTPTRTPSVKKSASFYSGFSTDENVDKMKQRAARNQTFIYIKIPEIPICFSYKGEKERNIEDAHDFSLRLPTLEYHSKTWTWQDLSMAMKKDYTQELVPQIIKEKLHLKGDWDNKKSLSEVGDDDKAKMLLGDLPGTQKKTGKKLLFGKLTSLMTKGNNDREGSAKATENDKSAELSGKGIDPLALKDKFNRLRTVSKENLNEDT